MATPPKPFADLVVIELGHSVAAPFAGQIFGDLGAEVIKVEKADGDDARKWGPPFWEGASATFQTLNRSKRSVVCDLRSPRERDALVALVRDRADVVLQNLRPGQVEELGLDAATLLAIKPSLIYCNLGAFGRHGPLRDRPGYDPLMQAFGGVMSTTGEPGRPSVRVGPSIVDMGTGMWAVIGILAALRDRAATGKGSVVDVSLFETTSCWVSLLASQYLASGESPGKQGSGASGIVPYKAYATRDGELWWLRAATACSARWPNWWAIRNGSLTRALPITRRACTTRRNCIACSKRSCCAKTARTGSGGWKQRASPAHPCRVSPRWWVMLRPPRWA